MYRKTSCWNVITPSLLVVLFVLVLLLEFIDGVCCVVVCCCVFTWYLNEDSLSYAGMLATTTLSGTGSQQSQPRPVVMSYRSIRFCYGLCIMYYISYIISHTFWTQFNKLLFSIEKQLTIWLPSPCALSYCLTRKLLNPYNSLYALLYGGRCGAATQQEQANHLQTHLHFRWIRG